MIKLSRRLKAIADFVPHGSRLADIGTDHALLPVYLVRNGLIPHAIAGELNDGPFQAAREQVKRHGLQDHIDIRQGNGLSVLRSHEADTVTIAGMGGGLIADILEAGYDRLDDVRTLILQPNVAEDMVRRWLLKHDYVLLQEHILIEDGIPYIVLYAEHAGFADVDNDTVYRPRVLRNGLKADLSMLLQFGPYLLERMEEAFLEKWQEERRKLEAIRRQITQSAASSQAEKRLPEIDEQIVRITEVLQCSPKVRQSFK